MYLVTALSALLGVVGVLTVSSAGASQQATNRLVAGFLPDLDKATFITDMSATQVVSFGVGVADPHPTAEHAFYDSLYQQGSSSYHDFLTVQQFDTRFGVTPATVSAVRNFLTSTGGTITYASDSGDYFMVSASVADVEKLFHVTLGDYSYEGAHFMANNKPATVPAALPIDGTLGLNTYAKMSLDSLTGHQLAVATKSFRAEIAKGREVIAHNAALKRAATRTGASTTKSTTGHVVTAQAGSEQVFTPQDLWGMYDDPGASALTNSNGTSTPSTVENSTEALGQGQTIGIFGAGEMSSIVPQLRLFEAAEGLPKVPVRMVETEGGPDSAYDGLTGDAVEWYLDSQASTGMAPDVKQLDYYFAKNFYDADVENLFSDWAGDPNGPKEMNASFGECEGNPLDPVEAPLATLPVGAAYGYSLETVSEATLEKAAIEGRTLFTSAGDTGSGCPEITAPVIGGGNGLIDQPVPEVGYPCASEYAVCVGGTVLSSQGTDPATYPKAAERDAETAWEYGGGGTSLFIPKPSFQDGVTAIDTNCISQPDGSPYATTTPCRAVPDVADMSGNVDGDAYFIYIDGSPSSEGGTSLSSPLMMGQWARIQSAASAATQAKGGLGFADPTIYNVAAGADTCDTGTLDSLESEVDAATPCTNKQYESDFYDITQGEDVGDAAGIEGAGSIDGFNNVNTGVGTPNSAYFPAPGWDYNTGWGALNVANFMTTVDGTNTATDAYTGAEDPAIEVSTAAISGVPDSATDPVTGNDDSALNLTGATLSATSSTISATLTAPQITSGVPAEATGGDSFYVMWSYGGTVYYATANESLTGAFSYSSGDTTSGIPDNDASSKATGSVDDSTGVITINVPASEVGTPTQCSLLTIPQAYDVIEEGANGVLEDNLLGTVDSSDNYRGYSVDGGQSDSIEESVVVGGTSACGVAAQSFPPVAATTTTTTKTKTSTMCQTTSKLPLTAITQKSLSAKLIKLSGTARAHCPDTIVKVGVALARTLITKVKGKRKTLCEFLTSKHRFTKAGSCAPRDYLRAKGTSAWSFDLKVDLKPGVYYIWEHATDSKKYVTRNVASRHVFLRIR